MSTPSSTLDTRSPAALIFPKPLHTPISCAKCKITYSIPPTPQWNCPKCESTKVWQDYDSTKNCSTCASALGITNRRHCHRCGSCVCNECGQYSMYLTNNNNNNKKEKQRICKGCAFPARSEGGVDTTAVAGFLMKVKKDPTTGKESSRVPRYFELRKNVLMSTEDRTTAWKNFFILDGGVEVVGGLAEDPRCGFTIQYRKDSGAFNPSIQQYGSLCLIADNELSAQKWITAIQQACYNGWLQQQQQQQQNGSASSTYFIDDATRKPSLSQQQSANSPNLNSTNTTANTNNNNNLNPTNSNVLNNTVVTQNLHRFDKMDPRTAPRCTKEGLLIKIGAKSVGARNERHFRLFENFLQYAEGDRSKSPAPKDEYDILGAQVTSVSFADEPSLLQKDDCAIKIDKGPLMKRSPLFLVAENSLKQKAWIVALQAAAQGGGAPPVDANVTNSNNRSPSPFRQDRIYQSPDRISYPKFIGLHIKVEVSLDRKRRDPVLFDQWHEQTITFNSLDSSTLSLEDLLKLVENVIFDGRNIHNPQSEGILLVPGKLIAYRQSLFPVTQESSITLRDLHDLRGDDESAGFLHKLCDYTFLDEVPIYGGDTLIWKDMFAINMMNKMDGVGSGYYNANSLLRSDRSRKIITIEDESYRPDIFAGTTTKKYFNDDDNNTNTNVRASQQRQRDLHLHRTLSVENDFHHRESGGPSTPPRGSPMRGAQHHHHHARHVSPTRSPRNEPSSLLVLNPDHHHYQDRYSSISPSRRHNNSITNCGHQSSPSSYASRSSSSPLHHQQHQSNYLLASSSLGVNHQRNISPRNVSSRKF